MYISVTEIDIADKPKSINLPKSSCIDAVPLFPLTR